jgi:hypothetical protein
VPESEGFAIRRDQPHALQTQYWHKPELGPRYLQRCQLSQERKPVTIDFSTIAPYLKDPLVLIGFFLFLSFLFARRLIASGIIPPVGAGRGAQIIRLILHYGFLFGVLVAALGFGLKYKGLSEDEQRTAIGLLTSELQHNIYVADELKKNTETLVNAAQTVSDVLRDERFQINHGLFPSDNADPGVEQNSDLYHERFEWLQTSGLLSNENELRRFREQNAAIKRTIDRTISTVRSLGDRNASRYVMSRSAFDANLPILRKITIANPEKLAGLYAKTFEEREKYFRVAESVEEYLIAVQKYCEASMPDRTQLAAVLAAERLTMRLLPEQKSNLEQITDDIAAARAQLSNR